MNPWVGGTLWKFAIVKHVIPNVWPIQEDTNLIQNESTTLEEVGFSFGHPIETMLEVYLAFNLLVQAIPMCML